MAQKYKLRVSITSLDDFDLDFDLDFDTRSDKMAEEYAARKLQSLLDNRHSFHSAVLFNIDSDRALRLYKPVHQVRMKVLP